MKNYEIKEQLLGETTYKLVHAYGLADALNATQQLVQQGYAIDFERNETHPVQLGSMFVFGMKKVGEQETADAAAAQEPAVKATRKAKGA